MMITLKELINRAYNESKECIEFEYSLKDKDDELFNAEFRRSKESPLVWNMRVIFDRTINSDSQVYNFVYELPKTGMDLVMICAIGLKYFQMYIKEEVQLKSNIDFSIGDITNGMLG